MIPVVEEDPDLQTLFKVYERCFFCGKPSSTWYERMNQPVCTTCAEKHDESEVPPCVPGYVPK